jgi:hypothetical protein
VAKFTILSFSALWVKNQARVNAPHDLMAIPFIQRVWAYLYRPRTSPPPPPQLGFNFHVARVKRLLESESATSTDVFAALHDLRITYLSKRSRRPRGLGHVSGPASDQRTPLPQPSRACFDTHGREIFAPHSNAALVWQVWQRMQTTYVGSDFCKRCTIMLKDSCRCLYGPKN